MDFIFYHCNKLKNNLNIPSSFDIRKSTNICDDCSYLKESTMI